MRTSPDGTPLRPTPRRAAVLAIILLFCVVAPVSAQTGPASASSTPLPQPLTVLTNANVVNVRNGEVSRSVQVVLRDGKIESIGSDPAPADARTIDLEGGFVLPGLIDAHTHLDTLDQSQRALRSGASAGRRPARGRNARAAPSQPGMPGWRR